MFYTEEIEAKNIKKLDICPYEEWINVKIDGKEYNFSLLNTNVSYMKVFYLDYYKNRKVLNLQTREIQDDFL